MKEPKKIKKNEIELLNTKLAEKMNNIFSLFISEYKESCNTQYILIITLIEEWKKN